MKSRILVIDDNPAIYEDFCRVLQKGAAPSKELLELTNALFGDDKTEDVVEEYQIDFAQRGQDGVALARVAHADNWPYAIAFVDMRMPNGWDGLETIQQLWQADPHVQIVLCTAYSDYSWQEIRKKLARSDRFLILKKPFDSIEVQQIVETLIARQKTESLLQESTHLLQRAQHIARMGHYTLSPSLKRLWRSDALNTLFGLDPETPQDFDDFIRRFSNDSREAVKTQILKSMKHPLPFELVCQFRLGDSNNYAWCLAAGYWDFDGAGQPLRFTGTLHDITQVQALQNQLRIMEACVAQANDVIIITDAQQKNAGGPHIVYVNGVFEEKTGHTAEYAIGKSMDILYGPESSASSRHTIEQALKNEKAARVELRCYSAKKAEFWIDATLSPVRNKEGTVTHWLHTHRDVSSHKSSLGNLTNKEYKVVKSVARSTDSPLKDIAESLHISEHTLRNHLASIYEKLGLKNRLELYVFCSKFMDELNDA